jgi:hypothetical protein
VRLTGPVVVTPGTKQNLRIIPIRNLRFGSVCNPVRIGTWGVR